MQDVIFKALKKRWYIIFILGLLVSIGMVCEKNYTGVYKIKTGNSLQTRIVELKKYDYKNVSNEFALEKYMKVYSVIDDFLKTSEARYDYSGIVKGWASFDYEKKYKWVQQHIYIHNLGENIYEVCLNIPVKEANDLDYILQINSKLLDDYIAFANNKILELRVGNQIRVLNSFEMLPVEQNVNKNQILKKYAIMGFVLGAVLAVVGISITSLKGYKNGK